MRVKQRLLYHKQRDAFIGDVDYGVNFPKETTNEPVLANSLLCFVLNCLSVSFKIPVAYVFARNCTGRELHVLMRHVLKEVEEIGFFVVRIVTDNHKINVLAMQLLCNGSLKHCIDHPGKPNRKLFLAFDQCHLIKNVRSQFLSRDIGKGGEISANHLKSLYRMQQGSLVKPVRFLTRKHVFRTNIEKLNEQRARQVFSPPVTAAMKLLQEQAGHTCDASFAGVGPTVEFMDTVHRWFVLMDVCDANMHIVDIDPRFPGSRHTSYVWRHAPHLGRLTTNLRRGECVLGDSGYPLEPWLLTRVPEHPGTHTPEVHYNRAHASMRNVVERGIRVVKARFRCLQRYRTLL
ncbi:hypothetical protein HPB49_016621 [Dermacentor silvarum]|uniref:Uncharacterized protein n=1 Tax=Dermacentor silvarum TaxID=543639 RepID=A0ACB8CSB9_DERSI|nr:hypothetical protein HPB49_016621 [Dermacentor silvarum]